MFDFSMVFHAMVPPSVTQKEDAALPPLVTLDTQLRSSDEYPPKWFVLLKIFVYVVFFH